jgi:cytochrome c553
MKKVTLAVAVALVLAMAVAGVFAASDIRNTKHNLAKWSGNQYRSTNYSEVCIFCHTPHMAGGWPLWNRNYTAPTFVLYSSVMFDPKDYGGGNDIDSTSKLCFSCHETQNTVTTTPLYNTSNLVNGVAPTFNFTKIHPTAALGTNLRDDHPIGFNYAAAQANTTYELYTPAQVAANYGESEASIFPDGKMTCSSCHDVHGKVSASGSVIPVLLRRSNASSMLCWSCHKK